MFLENYVGFSDKGNGLTKLHMQSCTYKEFYKYWLDNLFERVMRLFIWENTGEVKPKEIEQRLLLAGHCGITKLPKEKELTAMYGSFVGVTKYVDEFTKYMVHCPIYSGERTIGKNVVVINNTSLRNALYPLVHHYAALLAHTEVSLSYYLVRLRENGGIPVAKTEIQKESITQYQAKVFNGQFGNITDVGSFGVDYAGTGLTNGQLLTELLDTRRELIKSFYSDIGVKSAFEKRSNTITEEVEADTSLLLINISDMIKQREEGAKMVNDMFGTNWSVHIAEEIDYNEENASDQEEMEDEDNADS